MVGLPWKYGREKAKELLNSIDSRSMATKRSWSLKRSMERVPDKKKKGFTEMRKFLDHDRAEMIMDDKANDKDEEAPTWHLPSHLVFQKGKYRFCHDGRAAVNGVCLNDQLIGDLNMLVPLVDPVNNLRHYLYAFGTDIEAFFHNVLVDPEDHGVFRFFFF